MYLVFWVNLDSDNVVGVFQTGFFPGFASIFCSVNSPVGVVAPKMAKYRYQYDVWVGGVHRDFSNVP